MLLAMNSLNPQSSQSNEDLDAVIGRFQAWTMTQSQPKVTAKNSINEISYEQALRANARYRRAEVPVQPLPSTPAWTAPDPVADILEDEELPIEEPKIQAAAPTRKSRQAKPQRKNASAKRTVVEPIVTAPSISGRKTKQTKDSFAHVLRKETSLARVESSALRSSALTVRLSQDESSLIKARADEAQMSTSAYLRQCALEVESLRAQVQETLAQMKAPTVSATPLPAPVIPASTAITTTAPAKTRVFSGIRQWLIRRLGGQQVNTVC